jgi:hypothetical protein
MVGLVMAAARFAYAPTTPNDLFMSLCPARELLAGRDPYGDVCIILNPATGHPWPTNPLTAALVVLPLAWLPWGLAAALVVGLVAAIREGDPARLVVFLSFPYLFGFCWAQWTPLTVAVALSPTLLPLALVKPHIGLPILLTHLTWRRTLACAAFGLLTLALDPTWPLRWLEQTRGFDGVVPALTLAGLLLPLLVLRWRDPDARFILLAACVPQRFFHDAFVLAAVPRNRREAILWTASTWLIGLAVVLPISIYVLYFIVTYWSALALVLLRRRDVPQGAAYGTDQTRHGADRLPAETPS